MATKAPSTIAGDWDMTIIWKAPRRFWRDATGVVHAQARLFVDNQGVFAMEVSSNGSTSRTRIAQWIATTGSPTIYYMYDLVQKAGVVSEAGTYHGAAILHYSDSTDVLEGNYWTSRPTTGTFKLTRPAASPSTSPPADTVQKGAIMRKSLLWILLALVLVVGVYLLAPIVMRPDTTPITPAQEIEAAVRQASRTCLMNLTEREQRSIESGVQRNLGRYGAGGYTSSERAREAVNKAFSEAGQLTQDREQRDCMARQTDKFLAVVQRQRKSSAEPTVRAPDASALDAPAKTGAAVGYIYYEEDGGKLTDDGVFGPLKGPAPAYGALQVGQVLKSVDAANLRSLPAGKSTEDKKLDARQCVEIERPPTLPTSGLTKATSGGRLKVRMRSCP